VFGNAGTATSVRCFCLMAELGEASGDVGLVFGFLSGGSLLCELEAQCLTPCSCVVARSEPCLCDAASVGRK
jgi:hypothetical protein